MADVFLTRPAHEWERILGSVKVPGSTVLTTREWIHSEHASAAGLIVDAELDGRKVKAAGESTYRVCKNW